MERPPLGVQPTTLLRAGASGLVRLQLLAFAVPVRSLAGIIASSLFASRLGRSLFFRLYRRYVFFFLRGVIRARSVSIVIAH